MTMSHDKAHATAARESIGMSPPVGGQLFENGMDAISESMDGIDFDKEGNERQVGRLSIDERPYHLSGQFHNESEVGRLGIDERAWRPSDPFVSDRHDGLSVDAQGGGQGQDSDPFAVNGKNESSGFLLETPTNDEDEKKSEGEESENGKEKKPPKSSRRGKGVPTPARELLPDETEWRDFVSSGE